MFNFFSTRARGSGHQVSKTAQALASRYNNGRTIRGHKGQNSTGTGISMLWLFVLWKNALESRCRGLFVSVSRCRGFMVLRSRCRGFMVLESRCRGFLVLEYRCRVFLVMESRCRGFLVLESRCRGFLVLEFWCSFLVMESRCRGIWASTASLSLSWWKQKNHA